MTLITSTEVCSPTRQERPKTLCELKFHDSVQFNQKSYPKAQSLKKALWMQSKVNDKKFKEVNVYCLSAEVKIYFYGD